MRLDFSDPTRFARTMDRINAPKVEPLPSLADHLLSALVFVMLVGAGSFVALVLLGAIGG